MDDSMNQWAESGPYIWLRHATQYTKDGQTHTIEMSVPIPVGASAETRERLIREAEAGMSQLSSHVERRGAQSLQRTQGPSTSPGSPATQRLTPQPASNTRPTPGPRPVVRPASTSAPQTSPQPVVSRENEFEDEMPRSNQAPGGSGVPRTPARPNEAGNNMLLPQFIQYIKENLDLTPKQAMELLNVRSLSTGVNLRDAVEQLKAMVGTPGSASHGFSVRRQESDDPLLVRDSTMAFSPLEGERGRSSVAGAHGSRNGDSIMEVRGGRVTPIFDEEVGPEDMEEVDETFDDLEDLDAPRELTPQALEKARAKLSELRESQGAATASSGRLQALNNVAVSQVTEEQLQELVDGVWGISSLKKLKVDQVEALISWAKLEDDFAEQVEAVLTILEEERYARGNR